MRQFAILLGVSARAQLDRLREEGHHLDDAVGKALAQLERFPQSGPMEPTRVGWSKTRRHIILGKTGYILRYRVHMKAELIEVLSIRHEKQRPTRL